MSKQQEILNEMLALKEQTEGIADANTTSKTGIVRNILYIVSAVISDFRDLFETFKTEVASISKENERRTPTWYQNKALAFQYGYQLVSEKDYYDNSGLTEDEITASQIIKFAVAVEENDKSTLYLKVAKENKELLTADELTAFKAYMLEVSDIGVHISYINQLPDNLKITLNVWYNATLLKSTGKELNTTAEPVKEALTAFISTLNFNQEFINMKLIDTLQNLEAVEIAEVVSSEYKYNALDWQPISGKYTPYSGHLIIDDENLTINYIKN
jgi:hypothetical protein